MKFSSRRRVLAAPGFEERRALRAYEYLLGLIDLWKDDDPRVAEVKDTRKRLAGLSSSNLLNR